MAQTFAAACLDGAPSPSDAAVGVRIVRMLEAAQSSLEQPGRAGPAVTVPFVDLVALVRPSKAEYLAAHRARARHRRFYLSYRPEWRRWDRRLPWTEFRRRFGRGCCRVSERSDECPEWQCRSSERRRTCSGSRPARSGHGRVMSCDEIIINLIHQGLDGARRRPLPACGSGPIPGCGRYSRWRVPYRRRGSCD